MTSDQIVFEDIKINASIGVFEYEKTKKQPIVLSIEIGYPLQRSGKSDAIEDTLCYSTVYRAICDRVNSQHFNLVEHLAETISTDILSYPGVETVAITLFKPTAIAGCKQVGIRINRSNSPCTQSTPPLGLNYHSSVPV